MAKFTIHGPYELYRRDGVFDKSKGAKKLFWNSVRNDDPLLPSACGCYLFVTKAARGIKPWYVGLASKQTFEYECFTNQKIVIYLHVTSIRAGIPQLFFVAKRTKIGKFAKPSTRGHKDVSVLENLLIGLSIKKNPDLMNVKNTAVIRDIEVPGIINSPKGRKKREVAFLQKALCVTS